MMTETPLVSIIIPFLNAERFLAEAVESVRAQTYDHWELLLVDDGSTDGSTEIAGQYARQASGTTRYLEHAGHRNLGQATARNLGINASRGEYIACLDADDIWFPTKLAEQVAILAAQPDTGVVCGATLYWQSWRGGPEVGQRDYVRDVDLPPASLIVPPNLLKLHLKGKAAGLSMSNLMFRRRVIERSGGFEEAFRDKHVLYEDQAFVAKLSLMTPIFVTHNCWDKYRLHPDSCCPTEMAAGHQPLAREFFLNWLAAYLAAQEVSDAELWQALRKAQRPWRYPVFYSLARRVKQWSRSRLSAPTVPPWAAQ